MSEKNLFNDCDIYEYEAVAKVKFMMTSSSSKHVSELLIHRSFLAARAFNFFPHNLDCFTFTVAKTRQQHK
jgi:hypothetical protein